jgi:phosphate transport system substrate-binding protein
MNAFSTLKVSLRARRGASAKFAGLLAALCALALVLGCSKQQDTSGQAAGTANVALTGAGATFPFPLYSKWMSEYNRLHPNIRINYQSIGSGGGIRQIIAGTVDFGATDAPMSADEVKKAPRPLVHVPMTIGAVVLAYNVPGVGPGVKLTPEVIAGVFLGEIKTWNDPKIVAANPGVTLPETAIVVAHRSDGSGTTAVFTEYLSSISDKWKADVGKGKSVKWPTGLGGKGNEGVTGLVKTTPGAIGYLEVAYAKQNQLTVAEIQNKAGKFIAPSTDAVSAAANSVEMPATLYASIVNAPGEGAYPIAAYTYILVYEDIQDSTKGKAVVEFLWWALNDGQKFAGALDYAPLPPAVSERVKQRVKELKVAGQPVKLGALEGAQSPSHG